eukprot:scaffold77922_cov18-Tisochrysis_lutea.AAC.1
MHGGTCIRVMHIMQHNTHKGSRGCCSPNRQCFGLFVKCTFTVAPEIKLALDNMPNIRRGSPHLEHPIQIIAAAAAAAAAAGGVAIAAGDCADVDADAAGVRCFSSVTPHFPGLCSI